GIERSRRRRALLRIRLRRRHDARHDRSLGSSHVYAVARLRRQRRRARRPGRRVVGLSPDPRERPAPRSPHRLAGLPHDVRVRRLDLLLGLGNRSGDGVLPPSAFSWKVDFLHETHKHPFLGPLDGITSGSFTIPITGESSTVVAYKIVLSVVDSA